MTVLATLLMAVAIGTTFSTVVWAVATQNHRWNKARAEAELAIIEAARGKPKLVPPPPPEVKLSWCDLCEQIKPETEFDWYETIWRCQDCLCVRDNGFDECNCKRCYRQWLEAELDWESIYQQERRWIEDQAAKQARWVEEAFDDAEDAYQESKSHVGRAKCEVGIVEIRTDNNGCTTTHYSDGSVALEAFGEAEPVGYVRSTRVRRAYGGA